mgnify:CR=1 FL=1
MRRRRRRQRIQFEFNPKYLWIICIILCVVLMFVSYRFPKHFSGIKTAVGNFISPMQRGINSVGRGVSDKFQIFRDNKTLRTENELLKQKIEELTTTNRLLTQEKYELDGLRRLYELDAKYIDYKKVAARIIASDTNNWFYSFIVDKGTDNGIQVGMNVLAGNGLVGIVSETGKNWARVRSVIDDNSNVSGMSIETQDTCIVSGDLKLMKEEGMIRVEMISMDATLKEDSEIVTSHISDSYLQGILIGYIKNIEVDSSNMTKTAYLVPAVNFERLDEVLIITELKESYNFE